jgi:hypothetical protein
MPGLEEEEEPPSFKGYPLKTDFYLKSLSKIGMIGSGNSVTVLPR